MRTSVVGRLGVVVPARRSLTDRIVAQRSGDEPTPGSQESFESIGRRSGNAKNTELADFVFGCAGDWLGALVLRGSS